MGGSTQDTDDDGSDLPRSGGNVFPVYMDDFEGGVQLFDGDRHVGPYFLLLAALWRHGGYLPEKSHILARICQVSERRFKPIWEVIRIKFICDKNGVSNARILKELRKRHRFVTDQRRRGAIGGRAKSLKEKERGLANAIPIGMAPHPHRDTVEDTVSPLGPVPEEKAPEDPVSKKSRRSPERALPEGFVPDLQRAARLMDELDLTRPEMNHCYQRMRDHAEANDRRQRDWDAAFSSWVRKASHDNEIGPGSRSRKNGGEAGSALDDA